MAFNGGGNGQWCGSSKARVAKTTAGIEWYPAMGSGSLRIGRLQGGSCGSKGSGDVIALAAARLSGGQCNESM
jgi:hypothetical protein